MSFASSSSSSSQESLGFPPTRYANRRVLRAVDSVDELDALGFAGVPRRYASNASSLSSSSSASLALPPPPPFPAPPTYHSHYESPSEEDYLGFAGLRPKRQLSDHTAADDVIMTTNGDVLKAKLRYKMHKLKMGKHADEWHIFLNRSLKPGEAPWAPLGSKLWKVPKYELGYTSSEGSESEGEQGPAGTERRSSV